MQNIIDHLYVGSDADVAEAKRRGYARLAACKDGPDGHREMLGYDSLGAPKGEDYLHARKGTWMALNLIDAHDPEFIPDKVLEAGVKFIKEQINKGKTILVHCNQGQSRGPGIAMLYMRSVGELPESYNRAKHIFKTLYPSLSLGDGMEHKLIELWRDYGQGI